jgi:inner membrane protein
MPSAFSHAVAGAAIGAIYPKGALPKHAWAIGALCAALPDVDMIAFHLGIPYGHMLGHRGFSHCIVFALVVGVCVTAPAGLLRKRHFSLFALFSLGFIATASHGILDAMTDGGLGVAFFSPFSDERYFLPYRPIAASPLRLRRFFTAAGLHVMSTELVWIWLPSGVLMCAAVVCRRWRAR